MRWPGVVAGVGLMVLSHASCAPPPAPVPRCRTTALPNCPTPDPYSDEACYRLEDAESRVGVMTDASRSVIVDRPAQDERLAGATPFTFRWHGGLMAALPSRTIVTPPSRLFPVYPVWESIGRAVDLLPEAEAHCPTFSGIGYALTFRSGTTVVARAELSFTEFTPEAGVWAALSSAMQPLTLTVLVSRFRINEVTEGPIGPVEARRFTIVP